MHLRSRLNLESLETKVCPAVTASLKSGTLYIGGKADNGSIAVIQDSGIAGKIQVFDGVTPITGSPFSGVANIRLVLGTSDDVVNIDLGGQALPGNIAAYMNNGTNSLSLTNGSLNRLTVSTGVNDDTITLGNGVDGLTVTDGTVIVGDGYDSVTVNGDVAFVNNFTSFYSNDFAFMAGATVNNLIVRGGAFGNTVDIDADVLGNLKVYSYFVNGSFDGSLIEVSGEVDGSVFIYGSNQNDTITLAGNVGVNATVYGYSGNDSISIANTVTARLRVDGAAGDDSISIAGTVGDPVTISGGHGNDQLSFASTAVFLASARVTMGNGDDSVNLDNAAAFTTLVINGNTGTDTFVGDKSKTGLTLASFEL
jgi:hypothetical protein